MNYKEGFDPEQFRTQGHKLIDKMADYLAACQRGEDMPLSSSASTTPEDMLDVWHTDFKKPATEGLVDLLDKVMQYTTHLQHPRYIGHQVATPFPTNGLSHLVTGVMNGSGAVFEMGAAPAAMEKVVLDFMARQYGFDEQASGVLVSGGSLGNLTALLTARQMKAGYDAWESGIQEPLAIMVSEEAHYCVSRAVKIMGLGDAGIIKIPTDDKFRADAATLEYLYQQAIKEGKKVIAVVGNACSTSTGSFDDLEAMGLFCKKYDLWFHIDGAHGGATILSEKYKHLLKGIHHADSIVVDFHKMMLVPSLVTAVIYKNGHTSHHTFSQKADYLLKTVENNWYNTAARTIECTRPMMSVRVYATLKTYGAKAIGDFVTDMYDKGKQFAELIRQTDDFEVAIPPSCNIVCFRYLPTDGQDIDLVNKNIRQRILDSGRFYIVQTVINGHLYLRCTFVNPFTSVVEMQELLQLCRGV